MPRKVNLPGAAELFRATESEATAAAKEHAAPEQAARGASGRVRHDEKITVYVSREELLALEQLRIRIRGEFGLSVDRGRIVREALGLAIADVAERGADASIVKRLDGR